jgi:hypothetical protein
MLPATPSHDSAYLFTQINWTYFALRVKRLAGNAEHCLRSFLKSLLMDGTDNVFAGSYRLTGHIYELAVEAASFVY